MARLGLSLLGTLQITLDGRPASGFAYNKARALLAYLAVEADRLHYRDTLAGLLWPDLPDTAARTNLRQALADLRDVIGDASAMPPFLLITRDAVQLNPACNYDLDVLAFSALLAACERHTHRHPERCRSCAGRMEQAITLYRGDFLAGFSVDDSAPFEEWQLRHRERLHRRALDTLARLADYHERRSDGTSARRHAQHQVELEPWREEAHRQLMRLLARGGQRSAALAQYEICRRILARDLGIEPEAETTRLHNRIRDTASAELSTQREPTQHIQNFPAQTTGLIGRETELAETGSLLENPACRLVTITGPGGIGKTRLALAAAAEQADMFGHGAVFVPLQAISSAEFLAPAILSALDIPLQGQRDPREQLLDYLRDKELLLVLDNFEQLLAPELSENEGGATLLVDMLQHAPGITLLVTSRARLALYGEWLVNLSGLSYPASQTINGIDDYGAVRLFLQRIGEVRRQVALAEDEARALARICRVVEGLPLAIELAAAARRIHSCVEIADAIEASLSALASSLRGVPERHHSMWATFEYSWQLLSDEERQVFPQLSVFRGGFQEDAAADVAQASPQILAALADKSLLRWDGVARYDMHELVRQYASEKLEQAGETKRARDTHLVHYLALAEAAEAQLVGSEMLIGMNRLDVEHDNARAGLRWAFEQGDRASALRLSAAMGEFWEMRGYWSEGRLWLEQALTLSRELNSGRNLAPTLARWSAQALRQAGRLAWGQSDFTSARELLEESLSVYRKIGDQEGLMYVIGLLGGLSFDQGEYASAHAHYEEYLALTREGGNPRWIGDALFCIGIVAYQQGEYAAAQPLLQESLKLIRESGYALGITHALNALGNLANLQGDYAAAQVYYEESLTLRRKLDYKRGIAATLSNVANVQVKLGQHTAARARFEESLALYYELKNKRGMISVLSGLAYLAQAQGQSLAATRLLSAVEALLAQLQARLDEPQSSAMEQAIASARSALGTKAFATAWAAGRALSVEAATEEALAGITATHDQLRLASTPEAGQGAGQAS